MSDPPVMKLTGFVPASPSVSKLAYAYASTALIMLNCFGPRRLLAFLRRAIITTRKTIR